MTRFARLESVIAGGVLVAALAVVGTVPVEAQEAPTPRTAPVVTPPTDDVEWGPVVEIPVDPPQAPPAPAPRDGKEQPVGGDDRRPLEITPSGGAAIPESAPTKPDPASPFVTEGVPNFVIRKFRVPLFLLPIYQAAGIEYGVRWEVLAAINEIETDYGRNLNVSSAGALGWMQFMPSSWEAYGVDANKDGRKDPFNPVDAIFAAARYLKAANYENDVRGAIFAYNHADWYVDSVLMRTRLISGVPADLVGSLTGLTEGRFPVEGKAHYRRGGRSIVIHAEHGAPVVAVNDGVVKRSGHDERLGNFVVLQDVYGNRYTYAGLGKITLEDPPIAVKTARGELGSKERLFAYPGDAESPGHNRLREGLRVVAGTVIGRVGAAEDGEHPQLRFAIRPAGRGAPSIDPKPILDGWKLLEKTGLDQVSGLSIGQIMLLPKRQLERRVLGDERIEIYEGGRQDIQSGQIDRRVLATISYLAESGLRPTITSLKNGHSFLTASGNVSHHSSGNAVDVAQINGVPIFGHQEPGGVTDQAVRRLMRLQGTMRPDQIISLLDYGQNTLAMGDHDDHIHVGFSPLFGSNDKLGRQALVVLQPGQWSDLISRLREIDNPVVPTEPSKYALPSRRVRP